MHGRKKFGKLNVSERIIFDKTINELINGWSVVSGQKKGELREKLDKELEVSLEKLKREKDESWLEKVRKGVKGRKKTRSTN